MHLSKSVHFWLPIFTIHPTDNDISECLIFVWFDSLRPINNLSFIKGLVFLGWTSTKLGLMFLLMDTTQWRRTSTSGHAHDANFSKITVTLWTLFQLGFTCPWTSIKFIIYMYIPLPTCLETCIITPLVLPGDDFHIVRSIFFSLEFISKTYDDNLPN